MGFEVFIQCFGDTTCTSLQRDKVRSLFPVVESQSEPNYWKISYGVQNSCEVGVTPSKSDPAFLLSLYVSRPCADLRLWESLFSILRMGHVVTFWPGSPPVVAEGTPTSILPADMIAGLGQPRIVRSGADLRRLVQE